MNAASASAATSAADDGDDDDGTVLPPGVVESRNNIIDSEIRAFLLSGGGGREGDVTTYAKSEFRSFFTVWMFLTRLPSPSHIDLHPRYLMRGMSYLPVVGSILGVSCAILHDALQISLGLPSACASIFVVIFGLCLTGCFHEDGLADTFDGMGGWSRSQVLKIMSDSRVGTFGCASLCLYLLAKAQLLGHLGASRWSFMDSSGPGPAILVGQALSRLSAPYLVRTREYVPEHGPKSPFYRYMIEARHILSWSRVSFAIAYSYALSVMFYGPTFAATLLSSVLLVSHLAGNEGDYLLGGVMGDYLGCTICVCEIVVLTLIVSRDPIIETCVAISDALFDAGSSSSSSGDGGSSLHDGHSHNYYSDAVIRRMSTLYGNDRVRPLVNLVFLMTAVKIWCKFVGPPDMYAREDRKKEDDGKED
ncbi:hypothetical protein ACHAXA_001390 [Cyclostephanos tholiformis]|uniref:Adenosylcobinamide-GDP ribazoletransferase n=1 Tax=Cyclostephanos tholiformis TaxID=382380 RepID=A0ABD3RFK3_9STRA